MLYKNTKYHHKNYDYLYTRLTHNLTAIFAVVSGKLAPYIPTVIFFSESLSKLRKFIKKTFIILEKYIYVFLN